MNRILRLARAAMLAAVAASSLAATGQLNGQPIRLGELNSYKVFPAFLEPYKKGMELALAEINAAGGVLGRPLEIVSRDDNGNPGDAVRVAEELLSREKSVLLMGTFASNVGLAVADLAKQRKVLFLAAEPLTDKIVWESGNRYTFRLARVDLHADRDARTRGGEDGEEALGDRLSELRIRPIGDDGIQATDDRAPGRRHRVRRAGGATRQDRRRRRRPGAPRRQAGRDLFVAVRARPRALRPRG